MSRTHKDAPRKVRERRLGITDRKADCALCESMPERILTFGFSAIFFAHETRQRDAFISLAEEKGYSFEIREVRGYLGEFSHHESFRDGPKFDAFGDSFEKNRAIYSHPIGVKENIIWSTAGRSEVRAQGSERTLLEQLGGIDDRILDHLFEPKRWVSHKENIFTVVSVSKEFARSGYYHYHASSNAAGYLLSGHCHCSHCEPDEKDQKNRVRSLTSKLRNAFNSGSYDELEEIAAELVRSSSGSYRDTMYC